MENSKETDPLLGKVWKIAKLQKCMDVHGSVCRRLRNVGRRIAKLSVVQVGDILRSPGQN